MTNKKEQEKTRENKIKTGEIKSTRKLAAMAYIDYGGFYGECEYGGCDYGECDPNPNPYP